MLRRELSVVRLFFWQTFKTMSYKMKKPKLAKLRSPRVASHRSKEKVRVRLARIIQRRVGYFNGWKVSEEQEQLDCLDAAHDIIRYLKRKKISF